MPNLRPANLILLAAPLLAIGVLVAYLSGAIPYRVYVVHTGSMSPTIPSRSAVIVHEGSYHVGQVITFRERGVTVTHRLIAIDPDGSVDTKGDANRTVDPWHSRRSDIVGGVVLAPHLVGYVLVYLGQPAGAASLVLALLGLWQAVGLTRSASASLASSRTVRPL